MLRYGLKQILNMAITLFAVSFIVFMLNELTPGDVVAQAARALRQCRPGREGDARDGARSPRAWCATSNTWAMPRAAISASRIVYRAARLRSAVGPARQHAAPRGRLLRRHRAVLRPARRARRHARAQLDRPHRLGVLLGLRLDPGIRHGRVPARDLRRRARLAARHLAAARRQRLADLDPARPARRVVVLYDAGYLIAHDPHLDGGGDAPALHPHRRAEGHELPPASSCATRCATP